MKYYIAYGSNLNLSEMRERCPDAEFVGTGILFGFRLVFKVYATIERDSKSCIEVGVFKISEEDEDSLDFYESYPELYTKSHVSVTIDESNQIDALVYIINDDVSYRIPDSNYFYRCVEGYKNVGIPLKQLQEAVMYSMEKSFGS